MKRSFCLIALAGFIKGWWSLNFRANWYLSLFTCNTLMCRYKNQTHISNFCQFKLSTDIEKNPGPTPMYRKHSCINRTFLLKVPVSPNFLIFQVKVHIEKGTSAKIFVWFEQNAIFLWIWLNAKICHHFGTPLVLVFSLSQRSCDVG